MALRTWAVGIGVTCLMFLTGLTESSAATRAEKAQTKAAADAAAKDPNLKPNPKVVTGLLPNGLRYAVMHTESPKGALSLRLSIDAGLYDEEDSERGAAHFVEHMAFAGARGDGKDDPIRTFEAAGVIFGKDQNAFTTLFETTYRLDLPSSEGPLAEAAFRWLRGVADGTGFQEADVARERGVLLAERASRASPSYEDGLALTSLLIQNPRIRDRMRLDPVESLERMDGAHLRAFYERWYRPERAVVVVVGDLPVEVLKKRVEEAFSNWSGKGPAPTRAPFGAPAQPRPPSFVVRATPHAASQVNVCRAASSIWGPFTTVDSARSALLQNAWVNSLQLKLYSRSADKPPPYLFGRIMTLDLRGERLICATAIPIGDNWQGALAVLQAVLAEGPAKQDDDTDAASAIALSGGTVFGELFDDAPNASTAIAASLMKGDVVLDSDELTRASALAAGGLKAADLRQAFLRDWGGDGPLVTVFMPAPPTEAQVKTAWEGADGNVAAPAPAVAQAEPPPPRLARGAVKAGTWPYYDFGKPGRVVKREHILEGDFNRYTFANGAVLNIKSQGFEGTSVAVGVRFGGGRMELANSDVFAATLGAPLLTFGGLGRLDRDQMSLALSDVVWSAQLKMEPDHFLLTGQTRPADLRQQLQVLAAFMTDPAFRPFNEAQMRAGMETVYRMIDSTPAAAVGIGQDRVLAQNGPHSIPTREEALAADSKAFERVLKPVLTGAPMEVEIAGDINEGWAVRWVAETFGALPPRSSAPRIPAGAWVRRFPDASIPVVRVDTPDAPGGVVAAYWPLYPANISQRREEIALRILLPMIDEAVRGRIRWKLGKAYGDTATISLDDGPDQGFILAAVSTAAGDADLVTLELPKAVEGLVRGDIDPADFERSKRALLADTAASFDLKSPGTWISILSETSRYPGVYEDISGYPKLVEAVTLEDVKRAAARWLARSPIIIVAAPPAPAPP
jgi:zinc protease